MYYHSYDNHECPVCGREFNSERAMHQHMDAKNHWPVECSVCDGTFVEEEDCQQHEYVEHHYCSDCDRSFSNYNNLRMHLNSSRHRGGTIACPYCRKDFTAANGLAHHLESNACPNAITTRDSMYRFVRSKDPHGLISKKLLEWHGSPTYEASGQAWNGYAYECYLCHREFNSLRSLNQHLSSAFHQESLYHCPNRNCRDFRTLAGIINHLESEACGIARFETVQSSVNRIVRGDRLLAF